MIELLLMFFLSLFMSTYRLIFNKKKLQLNFFLLIFIKKKNVQLKYKINKKKKKNTKKSSNSPS